MRTRERAQHLLSTPGALWALFVVGWLLRVAFARGTGMFDDLNTFEFWATRLVERGPGGFYEREPEGLFSSEYPPGYLYVLWALGHIAKVFWAGDLPVVLMKLPAMAGDLALAWLVGLAAVRLRDSESTSPGYARFLGCAAILLNPAFFFVSSIWGQVESVVGALLLGALLLIGTGDRSWERDAIGMAVFALAIGTKPQAAFLLPVVLVVVAHRYLVVPLRDAPPEAAKRTFGKGVLALAGFGFVAISVGLALFAPFGMSPAEVVEFYAKASSHYPYTGLFAFNIWGAAYFWSPFTYWKPDSGPDGLYVFGVAALHLGSALFVLLTAYVCYRAWKALRSGGSDGRVLFLGSLAQSLSSYAVLTRSKERHLFLAITVGAAFVTSRWARRLFMAGSVVFTLTLYFAYVFWQEEDGVPGPRLGGFYDLVFGGPPDGTRMRVYSFIVGIGCVVVALAIWRARKRRDTRPDAPGAFETVGPSAGVDASREGTASGP